jgi:hypothetical protein
LIQRNALSSVKAALVLSIALALGIWAVLRILDPSGNQGLSSGRGLLLIAVGLFAATTAVWSRLRKKKDEDL